MAPVLERAVEHAARWPRMHLSDAVDLALTDELWSRSVSRGEIPQRIVDDLLVAVFRFLAAGGFPGAAEA